MTADNTDIQRPPEPPAEPSPVLKSLEPLVGTWKMEGRDFGTDAELSGELNFEWLDGGFFLVQHVEIVHFGHPVKGIEIIGHDPDAGVCTSNYFDSTGNRFTYAWELDGDALTIWFGGKGSPAGFTGRFGADRQTITGAWEWPGGGYSATMTKVA